MSAKHQHDMYIITMAGKVDGLFTLVACHGCDKTAWADELAPGVFKAIKKALGVKS